MSERLQKYLSRCGVASRRSSEKLIVSGEIVVNGKVVTELGFKIDPLIDEVFYLGKRVLPGDYKLFLYHKPTDMVTTMSDPGGRRSVGDFINGLDLGVYPVGRLDRDVSGLLLLTNDGSYCFKLTHPKFEVPRTYVASLSQKPTRSLCKKLMAGVKFPDSYVGVAKNARIGTVEDARSVFFDESLYSNIVVLTVAEGRKHFVKDLFKLSSNPVVRLARVSYGPYSLDSLAPGSYLCLLYTSPSPRDKRQSRMPSSA